MRVTRGEVKYRSLPGTRLLGIELRTCTKCGERYEVLPRLPDLNRTLAGMLVRKASMLTGDEIRFLRKVIGWSGQDFAAYMGVDPATVSRWENGHDPMSPTADRLLRMYVVHTAPVKDFDVAPLARVMTSARRLKPALRATVRGWAAA